MIKKVGTITLNPLVCPVSNVLKALEDGGYIIIKENTHLFDNTYSIAVQIKQKEEEE